MTESRSIASTDSLVLGGGGPVGVAWTAALLNALITDGIPLTQTRLVLGTSAGSVAGAWLLMKPDGLQQLPHRMLARARHHASNTAAGYGDKDLLRRVAAASGHDLGTIRNIGQAAIAAIAPISTEQADAMWQTTLPDGPWPRQLRVTSVNTATGTATVWTPADGISLATAVACSTAAPGIAPPVAVGDTIWMDGGVRSVTNADLVSQLGATAPGRVLVVAPLPSDNLTRERDTLVKQGYRVEIITAEPFYQTPADMLNPQYIDIAAAAGAKQARGALEHLSTWWNA
ncbi:patatin-like phospholipase family protein [Micromonospora sp. NPDC049559]|uniref:patatin-like phospholipase family protein n=1 Tax=Micromonospora sp. NPDC049559 TaxID=3155923 RepID=UPI0034318548